MSGPVTAMPEGDAGHPLALPESLDLTAAEPLAQALRQRLLDGPLLLDAGAVVRISTPCLQVLAAAAVSARARGVAFRLRHATPDLAAAIADLGLAAALPIEE